MKTKDEFPHFIINSEGRKIENKEQILKEHKIIHKSKAERKKKTQMEVKKPLRNMENNKSGDPYGKQNR